MKKSGPEQFEFAPATVYLETQGGSAVPLIPKGTPLPARRSQIFSTTEADQEKIELQIYFGEAVITASNARVGSVEFSGIGPAPRGIPEVLVNYELSRTGKFKAWVTADGESLEPPSMELSLGELWSQQAVDELEQRAAENRQRDERTARMLQVKSRARSAIATAEARMENGQVLNKTHVNQLIANVGKAMVAEDLNQIQSATDALERAINPFSDLANLLETIAETPRKSSTKIKRPPSKKMPPKTAAIEAERAEDRPLGRVFGGGSFTLDAKLCFVLMPFTSSLEEVYQDHIRPTVEKLGMVCERADEISEADLITRQIWEKINRARFLVADLTGRNANVFYEVGLAHAIGKEVILLTQNIEEVPFDLRAIRCLAYSHTPRGARDLEKELTKWIESAIRA
ncbi:MAG: Hsp70 family protein [Dehalococcoidia bacterium]